MGCRRVVIVAGGETDLSDLKQIQAEDTVIGVDGGILPLLENSVPFHRAVGDFDTVATEVVQRLLERGIPVEELPAAKDMTDTRYAVERGLEEDPEEILILGGLGGPRMDHAFANLLLLERIEACGVHGVIRNQYNRIRLLTGERGALVMTGGEFRYVSLLALTDRVEGVTLEGFLYPLTHACLTRENPVGISNELTGKTAHVRIREGQLLVMESRDR
ncbi:thiamine diphosphokinase [Salinithrix halophila]|uniref:Thiamine diphosphokinase n=1 Tax=Salinithrix halophila TaxID=1485204 RepID=A0ABV8JF70_9BACL